MKEYLLLLPIIFIFHDMEEIVGLSGFQDITALTRLLLFSGWE